MFICSKVLILLFLFAVTNITAQPEKQEQKEYHINKVINKEKQKILGVGLGICSAYILYTALFQICIGSVCGYASYWLLANSCSEEKTEKQKSTIEYYEKC